MGVLCTWVKLLNRLPDFGLSFEDTLTIQCSTILKAFITHRIYCCKTVKKCRQQYNAIIYITRAWSVGGPKLRRGQSLGGKMARCGSKRRRGKNDVLWFLLKQANDELLHCELREEVYSLLMVLTIIVETAGSRSKCLS